MASEAARAYQRDYERVAYAHFKATSRGAEQAARERRLATGQQAATPHRERREVEMEAGAVFKPLPLLPLKTRLKMIDRQIAQLQHARRQLEADQAHEPTQ
jgi:uncharacterized protein involved in type VI secretion and phage assembly